jgi:hypothetical protein
MFMFISSFSAVKKYVWKNAEFFRIWPNFFQKFADNSFSDLATVQTMTHSDTGRVADPSGMKSSRDPADFNFGSRILL